MPESRRKTRKGRLILAVLLLLLTALILCPVLLGPVCHGIWKNPSGREEDASEEDWREPDRSKDYELDEVRQALCDPVLSDYLSREEDSEKKEQWQKELHYLINTLADAGWPVETIRAAERFFYLYREELTGRKNLMEKMMEAFPKDVPLDEEGRTRIVGKIRDVFGFTRGDGFEEIFDGFFPYAGEEVVLLSDVPPKEYEEESGAGDERERYLEGHRRSFRAANPDLSEDKAALGEILLEYYLLDAPYVDGWEEELGKILRENDSYESLRDAVLESCSVDTFSSQILYNAMNPVGGEGD